MLVSVDERRRAMREKMKQDIKNKEKGLGKSIFDTSKYDEVPFFDPKQGTKIKKGVYTCLIDIVPWIIKTDKYPDKSLRPGYEALYLEYGTHRGLGSSNDNICCPKFTYKKKCFGCDESQRLYDEDQEKEARKMKASRRVAYNIIDLQNREKGVQIFRVSRKNFHLALLSEIEIVFQKTGEEISLFREDGYSIEFRATINVWEKIEFFKFSNFEFEKREDYSEEILEHTYPLDEMLVVTPNHEIKQIILNKEEDEPDEKKSGNNSKSNIRKRKEQTNVKDKPKSVEDMSILELRKHVRQNYPDIIIEKEMQAADLIKAIELNENKSSSKMTEKNNTEETCPFGHDFGADCDEFESCLDCDRAIWQKCAKAYDAPK